MRGALGRRGGWLLGVAAAMALAGGCGLAGPSGPGDGGGPVIDGGPESDGGPVIDGGPESDGGPSLDGGPSFDGGPTLDGGSESDGGPSFDGGSESDGGPSFDGGPTADGGSAQVVRFVAMGDTGKGNAGQQQVAAAVAQKCAQSGCDFVVLLGDNIYESGVDSVSDDQWRTKFEEPYAAIPHHFYAVLGNHDYGGNGAGYEFDKGPIEVEYTANSTKWKMPDVYYHFTRGQVELFALDTNAQMYQPLDANRVEQQQNAVSGWINASTATWKIALGHHPYLSNGPHGNAGSYDGVPFVPIANGQGVKDFLEGVICGKVDLYLCGHDHSRQWMQGTCGGTELAVSGAGASATELPGSNPTRFQANTLGFLYVRIEGRTLTADFVDVNGNVEYTRTLAK